MSRAVDQRNADIESYMTTDYVGGLGNAARRAFNRPDAPPLGGAAGGGGPVTPPNKGAEDAAKKYEKLKDQLELTARAQDQMTAAARAGDVAFEEQKVTLEAQQKILDIFGVTVGRGTRSWRSFAAPARHLARQSGGGLQRRDDRAEKQNEVLGGTEPPHAGQAPELDRAGNRDDQGPAGCREGRRKLSHGGDRSSLQGH